MALAVYIKAPPKRIKARNKKRERTFFGFLILVGITSIVFAAWPFLVWQANVLPRVSGKSLEEVPIPQAQVLSAKTILENVQVAQDPDGFSYFTTDYKPQEPRPQEFFLTVPKIKVENARVLVDNLKFDKNLALFPGTALPGQIGNSFITGHSVLPQFADAKNYRSIFTKLSDLEIGDEITAELSGKNYHYVVQYSKVINPKDLSVLAPISQNGRNLTLMTCVPPGTNLKRLVVIASLI